MMIGFKINSDLNIFIQEFYADQTCISFSFWLYNLIRQTLTCVLLSWIPLIKERSDLFQFPIS